MIRARDAGMTYKQIAAALSAGAPPGGFTKHWRQQTADAKRDERDVAKAVKEANAQVERAVARLLRESLGDNQ